MPNDTNLFAAIEPEASAELLDRRAAILKGARTTAFMRAALAIGSAPVALAALSREVYGQSTGTTIASVLNFALLLENLEAEFYKTVTGGGAGYSATNNPQAAAFATLRASFSADEVATLTLIRDHEIAHVNFLRTALGTGAPAPLNGTAFDFTGGRNNTTSNGPFLPATTSKAFLLAVTQAVEDTGVRAYKGQAANLIGDATVLEAALRIHAVEARHASKIRRLRRAAGAPDVVRYSGTIRGGGAAAGGIGSTAGLPAATVTAATATFEAVYGGSTSEANTTHAGANIATLGGFGTDAVTEAFDEPLTRAEVTAIVQPFVVASIPTA